MRKALAKCFIRSIRKKRPRNIVPERNQITTQYCTRQLLDILTEHHVDVQPHENGCPRPCFLGAVPRRVRCVSCQFMAFCAQRRPLEASYSQVRPWLLLNCRDARFTSEQHYVTAFTSVRLHYRLCRYYPPENMLFLAQDVHLCIFRCYS